jgi:hypothetical protein
MFVTASGPAPVGASAQALIQRASDVPATGCVGGIGVGLVDGVTPGEGGADEANPEGGDDPTAAPPWHAVNARTSSIGATSARSEAQTGRFTEVSRYAFSSKHSMPRSARR